MTEAVRPFQIPAPEVANPIPDNQLEGTWKLYTKHFRLYRDHLVEQANTPGLHPQYQHRLLAVLLNPYARQLAEGEGERDGPRNFDETRRDYYKYGMELKPEPAQEASRILRAISPQISWSTDSHGYGRHNANNRLLTLYNSFTTGLLAVLPEEEGIQLVPSFSLEAAFDEHDGDKERKRYERMGTFRDLFFDPKVPEGTKRALANRIHVVITTPFERDSEGKPVDSAGNPAYGQEVIQARTYNMYMGMLAQVPNPAERGYYERNDPMPFSRQFFQDEVRFYLDLDTSHFERHWPHMGAFSGNLHYLDDPDLAHRIARRVVLGVDPVTGEASEQGGLEKSRDIEPFKKQFPGDQEIVARYKQTLSSERASNRSLRRKRKREEIKNAPERARQAEAHNEWTFIKQAIVDSMTVSSLSTDTPQE